MFYSGCFWDTGWYFPTFFEFLIVFSQWFCCNLLLLNAPSMLATSPFYSVILELRGTTDFPPWLPWVLEPLLCQPLWQLLLSLFLIVFFFWCCFPKSLLLTFYSGVSLEAGLKFNLSSFKASKPYLFRLSFWLSFLFVIFPKWAESISARVKVFPATSPYGSFSWVSWGTSLLFMNCYSLNLLILCCATGCLRRTYLFFVSYVSWHPFWAVSIPL